MPAIQLMPVSGADSVQTSSASAAKTQKLQGLQSTFTNYMHQNSANTAQTAKQQSIAPKAADAKTAGTDGSVQQQYEQYQSRAAAQTDKVSSAQTAEDTDPDTVNEAVEEAVEDIQEIIKENLGVDDEQIKAAMELLGLTQADLLNPQQVTALAAVLTGSGDAGMMLFHENFQQVFQETSAVTEDLLKNLGMTMEELTDKISEVQVAVIQPEGTETVTDVLTAGAQPQETLQQTAEQIQEQAQAQETVQVNPQETVKTAQTEVPRETVVQAQETVQEESTQTQNVQSQEEAQPQRKPVQEAQPQQEQSQAGQEETADDSLAQDGFLQKNHQEQQNTRFDFGTNAHHQEPVFHTQAPQNVSTPQAPLPQVPMQEVIDQIVEYTKINISEEVKSIEMQLNPENLGKVYLHVSENHGTVTAQLTAQNENIKEALIQQAAVLKDNLNQQGIKVDAVEVTAGAHEFESSLERDAHSQEEQARQQEEQSGRRSRRSINLSDLGSASDMDGLSGLMSEEERLVAQIMRDHGNNVDYKA